MGFASTSVNSYAIAIIVERLSVNKLRQALGDTADHPQYIETVPRVGYRFLAEVLAIRDEAHPPRQLPIHFSLAFLQPVRANNYGAEHRKLAYRRPDVRCQGFEICTTLPYRFSRADCEGIE